MDNDKDHVGNVKGGLKAYVGSDGEQAFSLVLMWRFASLNRTMNNPNVSERAKEAADEKLKVLEGK